MVEERMDQSVVGGSSMYGNVQTSTWRSCCLFAFLAFCAKRWGSNLFRSAKLSWFSIAFITFGWSTREATKAPSSPCNSYCKHTIEKAVPGLKLLMVCTLDSQLFGICTIFITDIGHSTAKEPAWAVDSLTSGVGSWRDCLADLRARLALWAWGLEAASTASMFANADTEGLEKRDAIAGRQN